MTVSTLSPRDILQARQRIAGQVRLTPVMQAPAIDDLLGLEVFFKCEQLQETGSFKLRGASHAVSLLPADCPGVATHSSGNHGAALARAAGARGLAAHVVMPDNAVTVKVEAVRRCGGQVHFCAPNQAAREAGLARLIEQGFAPVPPYDDDRIIAGQGSCALELIEQLADLDLILAPVGGGGLLAGTALAVLNSDHPPRVIGVEPAGADDTVRSLAAGERVTEHHPQTIADGLRALVGQRNLELIRRHVAAVITVDEAEIVAAMKLLWSELKQVIEPSGAVSLAGLIKLAGAPDRPLAGQRVGVILSGGNLDINTMLENLR